jgi:hypothetical protein
MPAKQGVGDGTGMGSAPEKDGLSGFQDARPENPGTPYDSNRGGRGPELPPKTSSGSDTPKD